MSYATQFTLLMGGMGVLSYGAYLYGINTYVGLEKLPQFETARRLANGESRARRGVEHDKKANTDS